MGNINTPITVNPNILLFIKVQNPKLVPSILTRMTNGHNEKGLLLFSYSEEGTHAYLHLYLVKQQQANQLPSSKAVNLIVCLYYDSLTFLSKFTGKTRKGSVPR